MSIPNIPNILNILNIPNILNLLRDYLHDTKDDWNYITPIDFYHNYYLKKDYFLIDLRCSKEYRKMHIKGSKNIILVKYIRRKKHKKNTKK
jgi:hypothetical protein